MRRTQYATLVAAGVLLTAFFAWADPPPSPPAEPAGDPASDVEGRIAPTRHRAPTYWSCQDDLSRRMTVIYLDTDPPTAIIERDSTRVTATLQKSASGSKYAAPGGVLFWIKGSEATVQWPPARTSFQCANLAG